MWPAKQFLRPTLRARLRYMTDEIIQDLKQFITQQLGGVSLRIDTLETSMNRQFKELSDSIADALDSSNDAIDIQIKDHETRITKLEHKTV